MDEEVHCSEVFLLSYKNLMVMTTDSQVYCFNTKSGNHDHVPLLIHSESEEKRQLLVNPFTKNSWSKYVEFILHDDYNIQCLKVSLGKPKLS